MWFSSSVLYYYLVKFYQNALALNEDDLFSILLREVNPLQFYVCQVHEAHS